MRRRSSRTPDGEDQEPSLFDLPLDSSTDRSDPYDVDLDEPELPFAPPPRAAKTRQGDPRPKAAPPPAAAPRSLPRPAPAERTAAEPPPARDAAAGAGRKSRFLAGGADLLVHAAIAVAAVAGCRLLDAQPTAAADWPALTLFLLTFSFLYTVLPLAFWGQTLGMAWAGLIARGRDGEALTFDQAARRWLGGLFTTATLGIPLLATGARRSLSDRVSGSGTGWSS